MIPSEPKIKTFVERHPRAAAAAQSIGTAVQQVKADAQHRQKEAEDRIRADERQHIKEEMQTKQKADEAAARKHRIQTANVEIATGVIAKLAGRYDEALPFFYTALGILNGNRELHIRDEYLQILFGVKYNFQDDTIAAVYLHIADCYQHKGDYFTAIKCYKKLPTFGIAAMAASNGIQFCNGKINAMIDGALHDAQNARNNNDVDVAQKRLTEAKDLATKINRDTTQIKHLEAELAWDAPRKLFIARFAQLDGIDLNADNANYKQIMAELAGFLTEFAKYQQVFSELEKTQYATISNKHSTAQGLLRRQEDLQVWRQIRSQTNDMVKEIAANDSKYEDGEIKATVGKLKKCRASYQKYSQYFSQDDLEGDMRAGRLLQAAEIKLKEYEAKLFREQQRQQNKQMEQAILGGLQNMHQLLIAGQYQDALNTLLSIKRIASKISHAEDLQDGNKDLHHPVYFSTSHSILAAAVAKYNSNAKILSLRYATSIVDNAITICNQGWNKILLERHRIRLIGEIEEELQAKWTKFHLKAKTNPEDQNGNHLDDEFAGLFNNIALELANNMTSTSAGQRWWPGNWSAASICIKPECSKTLGFIARRMIIDYAPATPPVYLQLPILTNCIVNSAQFNNAAAIPVAIVVPGVTVVAPPEAAKADADAERNTLRG